MGGVWERQIRTVRRVLAGLAVEQVMTDEALHTLMVMAEGNVNNRPITAVSDDPTDLEPLTPKHLLLLRPSAAPLGLFTKADLYCRKKWRQVQYMADLFWRRWTREYLPQLRYRSKWREEGRDLRPGDIVLVIDRPMLRNKWMMGRVLEVHRGQDGHVRSARLRTKDHEITRPIAKLSLLESVTEHWMHGH